MLFSLKDFRSQKILVKLLGMPEKGGVILVVININVSLDLLRDFIV